VIGEVEPPGATGRQMTDVVSPWAPPGRDLPGAAVAPSPRSRRSTTLRPVRARHKKQRWTLAFILPAIVIYTIVLPYPIVRTIYLSLTSYDVITAPRFVGLSNFVALFTTDPDFVHALLNTLYLTVGCIVLQLPLAFVLAFWLSTGTLWGSRFFRSTFYFPAAISGTAVGLVWQFIYQPKVGLIDGIVRTLGFHHFGEQWLGDPHLAIWAVVVSISWQYFGYHLLIFTAGLSTIPANILEAARIDGATEWRQLTRIVLPLVKPFIFISLLLITTSSIASFANVVALTNGGPGTSSTVLALLMYNNAFQYQRYGYGSAIAVVLLALNIVVTVVIGLGAFRRRSARWAGT